MPEVRLNRLFDLEGLWRVAWIGRLEKIPAARRQPPKIRIYFQSLDEDSGRVLKGARLRSAPLEIGLLPAIHLNAVLNDGTKARIPPSDFCNEVEEQLTLDLSPQYLRDFTRFAKDVTGTLIVPDRHGRLADVPDGDAFLLGIGAEDDPYRYVIPCAEIFRFFYASSSKLAEGCLKGWFLDPERHLWDPELTIFPSETDGPPRIWLRRPLEDRDHRHVARFAFDPYALTRAQEIFTFAAAQSVGMQHERMLKALPPIQGPLTVTAGVIPFSSGGRERLLITRLYSCDWKPPYDRLDWGKGGDAELDPNLPTEPPPPMQGPPPVRVMVPLCDVDLVEVPPDDGKALLQIVEEEINGRFPNLEEVQGEKIRTKRRGPAEHPFYEGTKSRTKHGSLGVPRRGVDGPPPASIGGVIVEPGDGPPPLPEVDMDLGDGPLVQSLGLFDEINRQGLAEVHYIEFGGESRAVQGRPFFVFPHLISGERKAWWHMDSAKWVSRMAIVTQIRMETRTRYVLDFQEKGTPHAMLVLWHPAEAALSRDILRRALLTCAITGGPNLAKARKLPIYWDTRNHSKVSDSAKAPIRLLERIFEAEPR